ncbi:MAG: hypothetical protein ACLSFZ_02390 [Frisingicoccus sp.]
MLEAQSGTEVICTIREMKLQSKNREILKKLMRTGPAMYLTDGLSIRMAQVRLKAGDKVKVSDADITFYAQWRAVGTDKYAVNYIAAVPKDTILTGVLPQDTEKYEEGAIVRSKIRKYGY